MSSILSVGLTGGIACGRTTIGKVFSRLGACVIDMDTIAHDLVGPGGAAVDRVIGTFGERYRDAGGGVARRPLGAKVFADREARGRLEEILHPLILEESERMIREFAASTARGVAITDAALLVETGGYRRYRRLIVVTCDPVEQLGRLMRRDGLSEADARARIDAQAPLEDKVRVADYIIDTTGTLEKSAQRVHAVWAMLLEDLDRLPDLPERRRHT